MLKGQEVIYQIFVRNFSNEGTFLEVIKDIPRLKKLGVDVIYLLPIHEIGKKERKGTYGSPYAIKDYFSISKDLGDHILFKMLVDEVHKNKMKIILDMVFNHTSPDNVLIKTHPEFYYYQNGKRGNRVGDWSDIVDLDTSRNDTQNYLLSVLKYWVDFGVDGFRFDVASLISISFFKKVREIFGNSLIMIAENVDHGFEEYLLKEKIPFSRDKDLLQYFDALYNYSWFGDYISFIKGDISFELFQKSLSASEKPYLLCLENHDNERIAKIIDDKNKLAEQYRYIYSLNGFPFIYMGQEYGIKHKPELFEKDPVDWKIDNAIFSLIKELIETRKNK